MQQILAITLQNLKSIPARAGTSLVAVVGVAGVVVVLVAVLSMARGFEATMASGTSADNVVVLRSGSSSELDSGFSGDQSRLITQSPYLDLASAEVYVIVDLPKLSTGTDANVPMRGVGADASEIRTQFKIIEGRMFEPGRREIIAGAGATGQFAGLQLGHTLQFGTEQWELVGIFESGGAADSELWADASVLQGAYRRGNSHSVIYARLGNIDDFQAFSDELTTNPQLSVRVERESDYFAEQSKALTTFISVVGYGIAVLMALGALFGALNTMYTAVSERAREIATLRAIGFQPLAIVVSVMTEAMLLASTGGVIGAGLAWLLFNGFTVSTLSFTSFTQVVFAFAVTPDLMLQGIVIAMLIGLIGGLAPALRAARAPMVAGLRA